MDKWVIRAVPMGNRRVRLLGNYPEELLDKLTSFTVPNYFFMNIRKRWERRLIKGRWLQVQVPIWDGRIRYLQDGCLPLGLVRALASELASAGIRIDLQRASDEKGPLGRPWQVPPQISQIGEISQFNLFKTGDLPPGLASNSRLVNKLRPYQWEALTAMLGATDCGGLLLLATGGGKTLITGAFFESVSPASCLFIVDELTLLEQARESFQEETQRKVGIIGAGVFNPQEITVATIQSLYKHQTNPRFLKWFRAVQYVVIDEIHVQMAFRNFNVVDLLRPQAVYGLTATLNLRRAATRIKAYALTGPVLYEYSASEGVQQGYLAKAVVVRVPFGTAWSSDDYQEAYNRVVVRNLMRNQRAEELIRCAVAAGYPSILLAERVGHVALFERRLKDLEPQVVWGGREREERKAVKRAFEAGNVKVIIANRVFKKGIDLPSASCAVNVSAGNSKEEAKQALGRLLRPAEKKRFAIYFDIADRGNRFEENSKSRLRAFKQLKAPVIELTDSESAVINREWFEKLELRIERLLSRTYSR